MASGTTPFFIVVHIIVFRNCRTKKISKEGNYKPKFKVSWHRYSKRFVVKKVMQKKNYNFLRNIGLEAYYREVDRDKAQKINGKRIWFTPPVKPERDETKSASTKYARL